MTDRCTRYTRKDAEAAFTRLISAIGGRVTTEHDDVGAYRLDWNGSYGGGNIELILDKHGAVSQPFGRMRRNAREFCEAVQLATDAIDERAKLIGRECGKHSLIVKSLHDGKAECRCGGWSYTVAGQTTVEKIDTEFWLHVSSSLPR